MKDIVERGDTEKECLEEEGGSVGVLVMLSLSLSVE